MNDADRPTRPELFSVPLPEERSRPRPTTQAQSLASALGVVRSRVSVLSERCQTLDDLLVGCLANDTGQADAIRGLEEGLAEQRRAIAKLTRLTDALTRVASAQSAHARRRDEELAVIAERQAAILARLTLLEPLSFDDATQEIGARERAALLAV